MAWRLRMKSRKAPAGMELIRKELEEYENKMREAVNLSNHDKMRNEITWPIHKIHYEKNRFLFNKHYKEHIISKKLLNYLIEQGIADGKLMAKWKKPGYERLCSLLTITKSNTNFGTTSVCRVPLKNRHGQILPNVMTGCVSCASGDGGPIWWDDPVPEIAMKKALEVDPGKAANIRDTTAEEFEEARREAAKAVEEETTSHRGKEPDAGPGEVREELEIQNREDVDPQSEIIPSEDKEENTKEQDGNLPVNVQKSSMEGERENEKGPSDSDVKD